MRRPLFSFEWKAKAKLLPSKAEASLKQNKSTLKAIYEGTKMWYKLWRKLYTTSGKFAPQDDTTIRIKPLFTRLLAILLNDKICPALLPLANLKLALNIFVLVI